MFCQLSGCLSHSHDHMHESLFTNIMVVHAMYSNNYGVRPDFSCIPTSTCILDGHVPKSMVNIGHIFHSRSLCHIYTAGCVVQCSIIMHA